MSTEVPDSSEAAEYAGKRVTLTINVNSAKHLFSAQEPGSDPCTCPSVEIKSGTLGLPKEVLDEETGETRMEDPVEEVYGPVVPGDAPQYSFSETFILKNNLDLLNFALKNNVMIRLFERAGQAAAGKDKKAEKKGKDKEKGPPGKVEGEVPLGTVSVGLAPLLEGGRSKIQGWFPIQMASMDLGGVTPSKAPGTPEPGSRARTPSGRASKGEKKDKKKKDSSRVGSQASVHIEESMETITSRAAPAVPPQLHVVIKMSEVLVSEEDAELCNVIDLSFDSCYNLPEPLRIGAPMDSFDPFAQNLAPEELNQPGAIPLDDTARQELEADYASKYEFKLVIPDLPLPTGCLQLDGKLELGGLRPEEAEALAAANADEDGGPPAGSGDSGPASQTISTTAGGASQYPQGCVPEETGAEETAQLEAERYGQRVVFSFKDKFFLTQTTVDSFLERLETGQPIVGELTRTLSESARETVLPKDKKKKPPPKGKEGGPIPKTEEEIAYLVAAQEVRATAKVLVDLSALTIPGVNMVNTRFQLEEGPDATPFEPEDPTQTYDLVSNPNPLINFYRLAKNPSAIPKPVQPSTENGVAPVESSATTGTAPATTVAVTTTPPPPAESSPAPGEQSTGQGADSEKPATPVPDALGGVAYLRGTIAMLQPLIERVATPPKLPPPSELVPPRPKLPKPSERRTGEEWLRHDVVDVVRILAQEYSEVFGPKPQAPEGRDERSRKFVFHLNESGRYFAIKEHLKRSVASVVRDKFPTLVAAGSTLTKEELDALYNSLYVNLVSCMHEGLNSIAGPTAEQQKPADDAREIQKRRDKKEALLRLAREAETAMDWDVADAHRRDIVILDDDDVDSWCEYSQFLLRKGDFDRAVETLREGLSRSPSHYSCVLLYGTLMIAAGSHDHAEVFLKKATELAPQDAVAKALVSLELELQHRDAEAKVYKKEAESLLATLASAQHVATMSNYTIQYDVNGDEVKAPDAPHPSLVLSLAHFLVDNAITPLAARVLYPGEKGSPPFVYSAAHDSSTEVLLLRGEVHMLCGRFGEAALVYGSVLGVVSEDQLISAGLVQPPEPPASSDNDDEADGQTGVEGSESQSNPSRAVSEAGHSLAPSHPHGGPSGRASVASSLAPPGSGVASPDPSGSEAGNRPTSSQGSGYQEDMHIEVDVNWVPLQNKKTGLDGLLVGKFGHALFLHGQLEEAEVAYELAVRSWGLHPEGVDVVKHKRARQPPPVDRGSVTEDPVVYVRLGSLYYRRSLFPAARDCCFRACELDPTCTSWLGLGIAYLKMGNVDEARDCLCEANMLDNRNAEVWGYLVIVALRSSAQRGGTSAPEEAGTALDQAVQLGLEAPDIFAEIGELFLTQGFGRQAADAFTRALNLQDSAHVRRLAGDAYFLLGERPRAVELYQSVLECEDEEVDPVDFEHCQHRLQM
eukprot:Rmarinus@m.236